MFLGIFLPRKHQGCKGCHKDILDGYTDNKDSHGRATDEIRKSYGYQLQIWSAKHLRKIQAVSFFCGVPMDTMASVSQATRTLRTLRMAIRVERMIHKLLNIFQIRNPAAIWLYIRLCVTGVLWTANHYTNYGFPKAIQLSLYSKHI